MTDISTFKKILERPYAPLPVYVQPRWIWIRANNSESQTGQFYYRVSNGPISKLFTCSLADARAAAASWGVPVKEYGPPEAFGRKPKSAPLSAATVDEFWHLVETEDPERLTVWLRARPKEAPALFDILETAFPFWRANT